MITRVRRIRQLIRIAVSLCMVVCVVSHATLPSYAKNSNDELVMVSLGDSFSSGEGIDDFYGSELVVWNKVKNHDWLAHRSKNSWPGMLELPGVDGPMRDNRADKGFGGDNWYFAAVSGAETKHMNEEQEKTYIKDKVFVGKVNLPPQYAVFDKIEDSKVDYVTLTLGGNDAGFSDIITDVVLGSTYLDFSGLSNSINETWKKFYCDDGIADNLNTVYNEISDKTDKNAHIIVAGYPRLLNEEGKGVFVSKEEASIVNQACTNFNYAIESVVNKNREAGMKISFVSVEKAFENRGAYSKNAYINEVKFGALPQDISDYAIPSAYSIHPNKKGAEAYAQCVQQRINDIEGGTFVYLPSGEEQNKNDTADVYNLSNERDIVLVLDKSGSMSGTPIEETKKASGKFVDTISKDAATGIVTYSDDSEIVSPFTLDKNSLHKAIDDIDNGGSTNIEAGLRTADQMLSSSNAKKKIIVLMSDGEPNYGLEGDELIAYSDELKEKGIYIYTLGFFNAISNKSSAQYLMEGIASEGCHYEVSDAESLVFFFGDIADQINGQKYIYVRIACPVDVRVSYDGETLDSSENGLNTRTNFGTLTFEDTAEYESYSNYDEESDDSTVKILRLKEGVPYDINIQGTGRGRMNYSIGFMDENGEYSDFRRFSNIRINQRTSIDTVAEVSDSTMLKVDEDGDGKYDIRYKAKANEYGKEVNYTFIIYTVLSLVAVLLLLILILVVYKKVKNRRKYNG